jgi:hypothetical protein
MRPDVFGEGCQVQDSLGDSSPGDATFFLSAMSGTFKYFALMSVQHKEGSIDSATWTAWSQHILMYFHQPGVQSSKGPLTRQSSSGKDDQLRNVRKADE